LTKTTVYNVVCDEFTENKELVVALWLFVSYICTLKICLYFIIKRKGYPQSVEEIR
jgi:hypothetical protein